MGDDITILLAGRSGAGKTATGKSIIEDKVFDIMHSSNCVTKSRCFMGNFRRISSVIDAPGSFDICAEPEVIGFGDEIQIHAVLLVLSLESCFSVYDSNAIERLKRFFGAKLSDYMIVVLSHGDAGGELSVDDEQLDRIIEMCGNRIVVFDNVTEDKVKKYQQRDELLGYVDDVVANNGGIPYTYYPEVQLERNEVELSKVSEYGSKFDVAYYDNCLEMLFKDVAKSKSEIRVAMEDLKIIKRTQQETHRETNKFIERQIEATIQEAIPKLKYQLADKFAEDMAQVAERKSNDEIRKMEDHIERTRTILRETMKALYEWLDKLREGILDLERQLGKEQSDRILAQINRREVERKSKAEISKLREDLERAQRDGQELQRARLRGDEIELSLRERILELEKMLADEQVARAQAEAKIEEVEKKAIDEMSKMRERAQLTEMSKKALKDLEIVIGLGPVMAEDEMLKPTECLRDYFNNA